jgi:hypothetical protein
MSTAKHLDASKMEYCEDRRIRWTNYTNISSWFDNWENDLVHLGFAFYDEHGQCIIPDEQLPNIINFDETCLSTDGSEGRRGGRPEIVLHDPHVPPPIFEKWGDSDEEELIRLKSTEVDMSETALGRYAALMKRQAFASVLDFTDDEWTNLKMLREATVTSTAVATAAEATADDTQMDEQAGEGQYNDSG